MCCMDQKLTNMLCHRNSFVTLKSYRKLLEASFTCIYALKNPHKFRIYPRILCVNGLVSFQDLPVISVLFVSFRQNRCF